jgi:hypothetical protein
MDPQILKLDVRTSAHSLISSSEIFAIVQQLSSQINESCMPQVVSTVRDLGTEENQLIVDLLGVVCSFCPLSFIYSKKLFSKALEKHHHLLMDVDRVLSLLTQIASSANVIARNRTLKSEHLTSDIDTSPGVYILRGEPPSRVRVIKRGKKDAPRVNRLSSLLNDLT